MQVIDLKYFKANAWILSRIWDRCWNSGLSQICLSGTCPDIFRPRFGDDRLNAGGWRSVVSGV